jgi:hypothetical protein
MRCSGRKIDAVPVLAQNFYSIIHTTTGTHKSMLKSIRDLTFGFINSKILTAMLIQHKGAELEPHTVLWLRLHQKDADTCESGTATLKKKFQFSVVLKLD